MPLSAALPILYGDNIGTCVTSLLSSLGASKNAKRAATCLLYTSAISIIQFKLEAEVINNNPEFDMKHRLLLDKMDYEAGTINFTF